MSATKATPMAIEQNMPAQIEPSIKMGTPNAPIRVYTGPVTFFYNGEQIETNVEIFIQWVPMHVVTFKCFEGNVGLFMLKDDHVLGMEIPDIDCCHGSVLISESVISTIDRPSYEKGIFNPPFIIKLNPQNKYCQKVSFSIINFRQVLGKWIKRRGQNESSFVRGRIELPNEDFSITLDCIVNNVDYKKLKEEGGYMNTWAGELKGRSGISFDHNSIVQLLNSLSLFLSFLNGREVAQAVIKGQNCDSEIIWEDYTCYTVDPFKQVTSWLPQIVGKEIGELWKSFRIIMKDDDSNQSMTNLIHWYLEANNHTSIGSIIFLLNAFELFFNWEIIEIREMLSEDAGRKLRMSDKIRLILSTIDCSFELPKKYSKKYAQDIVKKKELLDFPYMFTAIRNSLVHSGPRKRRLLDELPELYFDAIVETGIFYLELLILKKLSYSGQVASRISESNWKGSDEIDVSF